MSLQPSFFLHEINTHARKKKKINLCVRAAHFPSFVCYMHERPKNNNNFSKKNEARRNRNTMIPNKINVKHNHFSPSV
jgi:hypothetical protein